MLRLFVATMLTCSISLLAPLSPTRAADPVVEEGFKSLFNGKDLTGWDGNPDFWSVRDGAITGQTTAEKPTKGNTFLIFRTFNVADFELKLEYKIGKTGNSGIQYRSKEQPNWVVGGYQADFEAGDTYSGILYEERGRGILAKRGEKIVITDDGKNGKKEVTGSTGESAEIQKLIKKEDWNTYEISAIGNRLVHKINGQITCEVTDNQESRRAMAGILALQLHAGPAMTVQFRNIRIKVIKEAPKAAAAAPLPVSSGFVSSPKLPTAAVLPAFAGAVKVADSKKKIVLVAGRQSHGPGDHEFNAGVLLLKKCLDTVPNLETSVHLSGWPKEELAAFEGADAVMLYMDGGAGHPVIQGERLKQMHNFLKKGVGLVCVHYAVEVPKDRGGPEFLEWIGGYFEMHWSVNPHWTAKFDKFPAHPICNGVKSFEINDEWYYHMRFRSEMEGVTPILTAIPPESTLSRPDGPHSGNPHVRATKGQPQHVAWAYQRPDGGRGVGFTGGHRHTNWGDENFRKIVLNALLWSAKMEVPAAGVNSSVASDDLKQNLDPKTPPKAKKAA